MFFVVTTGRSGSQTIARLLSQSPDCFCLHEPDPVLVKEATLYHYGLLSDKLIRAILLSTRSPAIHGKVYGESNQKLSTLIPILADTFPESQFIWLVRDGRDVVASTYYAREWYKPVDEVLNHPHPFIIPMKEWTWYRLRGDLAGSMSTKEWEALTRFEKNCWLWAYTNRVIYGHLINLPKERWMLVRLETVFEQLADSCRFVGVQTPLQMEEMLHNRSTHIEPKKWLEWADDHQSAFERLCGETMDMLYPGWRDSAPSQFAESKKGPPLDPANSEARRGLLSYFDRIRPKLRK